MIKKKKCVGYGKTEYICENYVDKKISDHWCSDCEKVRRATITKQINDILASMAAKG